MPGLRRFILVGTLLCSWKAEALTPPPQNHVLEFGGFSSIAAPPSSSFDLGAAFTLEAWVFLEANSTNGIILGRGVGGFMGAEYELMFQGLNVVFAQSNQVSGSGTPANVWSGQLPIRGWTHVAGTLDNGTLRLFINGTEVGNALSPGPPPTRPSQPFLVGSEFTGALRQARVWSRALSAQEIQTGSVKALTGKESGLVAYWPMDDARTLKIRDRGPEGADLTIDLQNNPPRQVHTAVIDNGPYFELDTPDSPFKNCLQPNSTPCPADFMLVDFNHDGALDVVGGRGGAQLEPAPLFALQNDGKGHFADVTNSVLGNPPPQLVAAAVFVAADVVGNGLTDLLVADGGPDHPPWPGGQVHLLVQTPGGQLLDETSSRLPLATAFWHSLAVGDVNGDGKVDIYEGSIGGNVGNGLPIVGPKLLINDGSGHFADESSRLPQDVAMMTGGLGFCGSAFVDVKRDGSPDLVLGACEGQNLARDVILQNDGTGHFAYGPANSMPVRQTGPNGSSKHIVTADFDGDGWPDLLMGQANQDFTGGRVVLLLNNRDGTFRDASNRIVEDWASLPDLAGLDYIRVADFNGDGRPDFVVETCCGSQTHLLFINTGDAHFIDATEILPLNFQAGKFIPGDLGDGTVDIFGFDGPRIDVARNVKPFNPGILTGPCIPDFVTLCGAKRRAVQH